MLLAIDMGNTQIEIGGCSEGKIVFSERLSTDHNKTELEYAVLIESILRINGIPASEIDGAVISSVVPPLTDILKRAVQKAAGVQAMVVGTGVKTGLKILIDDPKQLGADCVVDSVGAISEYGAPLVIIDMGTATTVCAIDRKENYLGGAIVPGLRTSRDALVSNTAQLQKISFDAPPHAIGTNTVHSMQSGFIFGHAALLDGMIDRFFEELGEEATVVATGGLSRLVIPECRHKIILDPDLMLKGLMLIYERNRPKKKN